MKIVNYFLIIILLLILLPEEIFSQERVTARGTSTFRKTGVHRGNQVRTVFANWGVIAQPGDQGPQGAWKFDTNGYVGDVSPVVGVRLPIKDYTGNGINDTIVSVVITPVSRPGGGDFAQGGQFRGFEPIPGFANPNLTVVGLGKGIAMSHQPDTWPPFWPDFPNWSYTGPRIVVDGVDITPTADWNGYFGRGQLIADQESYFWMDDFADTEMFTTYGFLPDSNDLTRTGHALQMSVRGLQWSNFLAQDVIFWLYNVHNDGTSPYDKAAFGVLVGTYVGAAGDEWNDDASFFDIRESITYTWDFEGRIRPSANPRWQPNPEAVGYIAYAFLESPGNPFDGIDNDGDNIDGAAAFFTEGSFAPRTINAGTPLVLINKDTFERTLIVMPSSDTSVVSMGVTFNLQPGVTILTEGNFNPSGGILNPNAYDGIDNDLDGIIDENYLLHYRQLKRAPNGTTLIDTLNPLKFKNYITGLGINDFMLDERRDDGIDNDFDWNAFTDDVGLDGRAGTGDFGEGDGLPTSGYQPTGPGGALEDSRFPGEPNIDKTDVDESDQLGLTSFQYFVPSNDITMSDEVDMWRRLNPGYFDVPLSIVNNVAIRGEDGDFLFGSGHFPLLPGLTERFSLALAYGDDFRGVLRTKRVAQLIYNANYNFPRPPEKPTLTAVPGDGKVTLYWDNVAEQSIDVTTKEMDFEGYKIYKGTDTDFTDAFTITNAFGEKVFFKPIAQFDLKNGISGLFASTPELYELTAGSPFFLGEDSGIQNSFVDTDVQNGRTYYYAVVAYDRGKAESNIFPSENDKVIGKDPTGAVQLSINTVAVVPNAPISGYVPPASGVQLNRTSGFSTATPFFEVIDPFKIKNRTYEVAFIDSLVDNISIAYNYYLIQYDSSGGSVLKDTLNLDVKTEIRPSNEPVFNGFRLSFDNSFQSIDSIRLLHSRSGWNNPASNKLNFVVDRVIQGALRGIKYPKDYMFVFYNEYDKQSDSLFQIFGNSAPPRKNINFEIFDATDRNAPVKVQFAFTEGSPYRRDTLSFNDRLFLSTPDGSKLSWRVTMTGDSSSYVPRAGDTLLLTIAKPFSSADNFRFSTNTSSYDVNVAREQLNRIKAVPNPYVVTNTFEQPLPPQVRGRGERVINFINLPNLSKIHIYTSSGAHIRTLDHEGNLNDGTVKWDLRTKEGLDIAYGVYFYVVEVPGISDKKFGKLAIIK